MNITYTHPDILKDGQKVAQISDIPGEILTVGTLGGTVKGAIKKALKVDEVKWKVVEKFPPHGGPGDPVTGSVSPLETRSEPQAGEVSGFTPSPASSLPPGAHMEGNVMHVPTNDRAKEGWAGSNVIRFFKAD
jgi:hypothetical protein